MADAQPVLIARTEVEAVIEKFLRRVDKPVEGLTDDTLLHADGLELDSLATAELAAVLEDELGTDPYTHGLMPATIGEIVAFYTEPAAS